MQDFPSHPLFRESLTLADDLWDTEGIAFCLGRLAAVAMAQERLEQAAQLFGATERLLDSRAIRLDPAAQSQWTRSVATLRAQLDQSTVATAWAAGRAMSLEQAIAVALRDDS